MRGAVYFFIALISFFKVISCNQKSVNNLVICGPSGVGKGTLIQALLHKYPDKVALSVSQTTRAPRQGEVHGFHYDFIHPDTVADLEHDELLDKYLEYTKIHGNFYGTSLDSIKRIHNEGKICILDIDTNGVKQIKLSHHLKCKYMFIAPPSIEILEQRLRGRGTETEAQIQIRLKNALHEMNYGTSDHFDKILINHDLFLAQQEFISTVTDWFPVLKESKIHTP